MSKKKSTVKTKDPIENIIELIKEIDLVKLYEPSQVILKLKINLALNFFNIAVNLKDKAVSSKDFKLLNDATIHFNYAKNIAYEVYKSDDSLSWLIKASSKIINNCNLNIININDKFKELLLTNSEEDGALPEGTIDETINFDRTTDYEFDAEDLDEVESQADEAIFFHGEIVNGVINKHTTTYTYPDQSAAGTLIRPGSTVTDSTFGGAAYPGDAMDGTTVRSVYQEDGTAGSVSTFNCETAVHSARKADRDHSTDNAGIAGDLGIVLSYERAVNLFSSKDTIYEVRDNLKLRLSTLEILIDFKKRLLSTQQLTTTLTNYIEETLNKIIRTEDTKEKAKLIKSFLKTIILSKEKIETLTDYKEIEKIQTTEVHIDNISNFIKQYNNDNLVIIRENINNIDEVLKLIISIDNEDERLELIQNSKDRIIHILQIINNTSDTVINDFTDIISKKTEYNIDNIKILLDSITFSIQEYLINLIKDAIEILGQPPCKFEVVGLGSLAMRQMTPYSDLEFAFLTESNIYKDESNPENVRNYFCNLAQYLHFKIICLGETPIPFSYYEYNLDKYVKKAICFDLGGKTPLGREDKEYSLICTKEEMFDYLRDSYAVSCEDMRDHKLSYLLENTCYLGGFTKEGEFIPLDLTFSGSLTDEYQAKANEYLNAITASEKITNGEQRAIRILKGNVDSCDSLLKKGDLTKFRFDCYISEGKNFDVKEEIYRIPDRLIYSLGMIYDVKPGKNGISCFDILESDKVVSAFVNPTTQFSNPSVNYLKKAVAFANIVRLRSYSFYGEQKNIMDVKPSSYNIDLECFRFASDELSEDSNLFYFFYTTIPLNDLLSKFVNTHNREPSFKFHFFHAKEIYDTGLNIKASINFRLANYYIAKRQLKDYILQSEEKLKDERSTLTEEDFKQIYTKLSQATNWLSKISYILNEYHEALKYNVQSLKYKNLKDDILSDSGGILIDDIIYSAKIAINDIFKANFYADRARIYEKLNNFEFERNYELKALAVRIIIFCVNMTEVCHRRGDFEAEYKYNEIISQLNTNYASSETIKITDLTRHIKEANFDSEYFILSKLHLAITYYNLGDITEARKLLEHAESDYKTNKITNKFLLSRIYQKMAILKMSYHSFKMADELIDKSIKSLESLYSSHHTKIADLYYHKAQSLVGISYLDTVEPLDYLDRALSIKLKIFGEMHRDLAFIHIEKGIIHLKSNNILGAKPQIDKALDIILEYESDPYNYSLADIFINIAFIYAKLGAIETAIAFCEQSLEIKVRHFETPKHPSLIPTKKIIGLLYFILNKDLYNSKAKAFKHLENAHVLSIIKYGDYDENHPIIANCLYCLGLFHNTEGNYTKAEEYFRKALEKQRNCFSLTKKPSFEKIHNKHSYSYQSTLDKALEYKKIGESLYLKEEYSESVKNYTKSLEFFSLINADDRIIALLEEMYLLYNKFGKSYKYTAPFIKRDWFAAYYKLVENGQILSDTLTPKESIFFIKKTSHLLPSSDQSSFDYALTLENLGKCLYLQEAYDESLLNFTQALEVYDRIKANNRTIALVKYMYKLFSSTHKYKVFPLKKKWFETYDRLVNNGQIEPLRDDVDKTPEVFVKESTIILELCIILDSYNIDYYDNFDTEDLDIRIIDKKPAAKGRAYERSEADARIRSIADGTSSDGDRADTYARTFDGGGAAAGGRAYERSEAAERVRTIADDAISFDDQANTDARTFDSGGAAAGGRAYERREADARIRAIADGTSSDDDRADTYAKTFDSGGAAAGITSPILKKVTLRELVKHGRDALDQGVNISYQRGEISQSALDAAIKKGIVNPDTIITIHSTDDTQENFRDVLERILQEYLNNIRAEEASRVEELTTLGELTPESEL